MGDWREQLPCENCQWQKTLDYGYYEPPGSVCPAGTPGDGDFYDDYEGEVVRCTEQDEAD